MGTLDEYEGTQAASRPVTRPAFWPESTKCWACGARQPFPYTVCSNCGVYPHTPERVSWLDWDRWEVECMCGKVMVFKPKPPTQFTCPKCGAKWVQVTGLGLVGCRISL